MMEKSVQGERRPRRDKGQMQWTKRDLEVLGWVGEQYGVRRDHLAVLLGRVATEPTKAPGRLGETTIQKLVQRWKRQDLIETATLEHGQPSWVWLTRKGLEQLDLDYRYWEPKLQSLPHLHAVNRVRLLVEQRQPEAIWCSERQLNRERPFTQRQMQVEHRPDAEVLLGPQTVAVEVERSVKTPQRLPAICYELARRYDAIWYFCPTPVLEPMSRALAQLDPSTRRKFSLVELPPERVAVPGQPATPPPDDAPGRAGGR